MSKAEKNAVSDDAIRIPSELMQFLRLDTYSLLIKGIAGTGKTTLALSILKALQIKKNCLFMSTRISPEKLFQFFPWLNGFFGEPIRSDLTESQEFISDKAPFVDARLDEPSTLFERITNQLMDVQSPTIVIDSWDAIANFMGKEDLMNNARVLQTWRERDGAKIIYTNEEPNSTNFDYLVDGIVELKQKYHEQRLVREIVLSKLRGIRINRPSYVYSLNNSVFRSYSSYNPADFNLIKPAGNDQNALLDSDNIKTGYSELDDSLHGGFPRKGIVTIDIDSQLNSSVAVMFLSKIISNFVFSENPVLFHAIDGVGSQEFDRFIESIPSKKKKKVYTEDDLVTKKGTKSSLNDTYLESISRSLLKIRKENLKKLFLTVLGSGIFQRLYEPGNIDAIERLMHLITRNSDLTVFITRDLHRDVRQYLAGISNVHLKILEINGTLLLQSWSPWSHLYAIVTNRKSQDLDLNLEPIV